MKHIQSFAWQGRSPIITHFAFFAVWLFLMINDRAQSVGNFSELSRIFRRTGVYVLGVFSPPSRVTNFVSKILSGDGDNTHSCSECVRQGNKEQDVATQFVICQNLMQLIIS